MTYEERIKSMMPSLLYVENIVNQWTNKLDHLLSTNKELQEEGEQRSLVLSCRDLADATAERLNIFISNLEEKENVNPD